MPDPHATASGGRFADDMRRIREAHGISVEDIHRDTMISGHIIVSFEQDGLFEHPTFNRVYLRSFVRSYATAVDVDPDRALEELGRALDGEYVNELAVEYLDEEAASSVSPEEASSAQQASAAEEAPSAAAEEASTYMATDEAISSEPEASAPAEEPVEEPEPDGSQVGIWVGIGIVLLILIAWLLIGALRGADTETVEATRSSLPAADTALADSMQLGALSADSLQASEPAIALGDTMYFTVVAQDNLRPIRIQRDADVRRPYWIERGRVEVFPAQRQIVLEDELGNIRLLLNGYEYPLNRGLVNGRLVITRDSARTFLDTLRTNPLSLVVPADTNQIGS